MATEVNSVPSGAQERTGTVAFMATSLLDATAKYQSSVHNCESVFWICALSLLEPTATGKVKGLIRQIFSASSELLTVASAKVNIVDALHRSERGSNDHSVHIQVEATTAGTQMAMYYYLVDLSQILHRNNFSQGYRKAENFQRDCFKTLATPIQNAVASKVTTLF